MSSLWKDYIKEREGKEMFELSGGFAVFKINEDETCYLEHLYVVPELRGSGIASELCDGVADIAKKHDKKFLLGTVSPGTPGATHSMKVQLSHGFKISSIQGSMIVLEKEI